MNLPRILLVLLLTALLVASGIVLANVDTHMPELRVVEVPVRGLSRPTTLLQVSDLQGDRFGPGQERLDALLRGVRPDVVVLTGDMLDRPRQEPAAAYELVAMLRRHSPRIYSLPGNHDPAYLAGELARRGAEPLEPGSAVAFAPFDPTGREVALAYGVDDTAIAATAGRGERLLVLASHTPPDARRLAAGRKLGGEGVHLFIAGHTHGGQIRLPLVGALWAPMSWIGEQGGRPEDNEITFLPDLKGRLVDGMYERDGQRVFVDRGVGTTGYGVRGSSVRIRLLDRAEIVLYRFVPGA